MTLPKQHYIFLLARPATMTTNNKGLRHYVPYLLVDAHLAAVQPPFGGSTQKGLLLNEEEARGGSSIVGGWNLESGWSGMRYCYPSVILVVEFLLKGAGMVRKSTSIV